MDKLKGSSETITVYLPGDVVEDLEELAKKEHRSISLMARLLIEEALKARL